MTRYPKRYVVPLIALVLGATGGVVAGPAPVSARVTTGDGCAVVRSQAAKLAAAGQRTAPCVERRTSTVDGVSAAAGGCFRNVWVYTRQGSCIIGLYTYFVYTVPDLRIIGEIDVDVTMQTSVSGRSQRWTHTIRIAATFSTGQVSGTVAHARANCGQNCRLLGFNFDSAQILHGSRSGSATYETPYLGAGAVWNSASTWTFWFTTPGVSPGPNSEVTTGPAAHRCDDALGAPTPVGCAYVMASTVPEHQIPSTRYPKYARHVQLAIGFGVTSSLTRTRDEAIRTANHRKACPPEHPRPSGSECDEYPFQSTREGAASQSFGTTFMFVGGINGSGTPFVCGVSWLPLRRTVTPGGYSSCFIPRAENSGGGFDLGEFYIDNRVIDSDKFTVKVVP